MTGIKVTLATSEGNQHVVDMRMLETSLAQFMQTMINDLGPDKMQNKENYFQNIDYDTLKKR